MKICVPIPTQIIVFLKLVEIRVSKWSCLGVCLCSFWLQTRVISEFFFSIKTVTKSYKMDTTNFGLESVGEIRCKAHCTGKRWYTGSDNLLSTWLPKQYYLYCVITLWQRQETAKLSLNGLTTCGGVLFICGFTV